MTTIRTPETFDIVSKTVNIGPRKNLAQISKILTQITSGEVFDDDNPIYVPINDYVRKAILQMSAWFIEGKTSTPSASVIFTYFAFSCGCT